MTFKNTRAWYSWGVIKRRFTVSMYLAILHSRSTNVSTLIGTVKLEYDRTALSETFETGNVASATARRLVGILNTPRNSNFSFPHIPKSIPEDRG